MWYVAFLLFSFSSRSLIHHIQFASARSLLVLLQSLVFPNENEINVLNLNKTTIKLFTTISNRTQSSRALGWDTNDYVMNSYRGCGNLSHTTFTHTGYTGTQICADPERELITILLTNRVYPRADESSLEKIHQARQLFNNVVLEVWNFTNNATTTHTKYS